MMNLGSTQSRNGACLSVEPREERRSCTDVNTFSGGYVEKPELDGLLGKPVDPPAPPRTDIVGTAKHRFRLMIEE